MPKRDYAIKRLQDLMDKAKARRQKALKMHEGGMCMREIGEKLGGEKPISRGRVSQMITRARLEK